MLRSDKTTGTGEGDGFEASTEGRAAAILEKEGRALATLVEGGRAAATLVEGGRATATLEERGRAAATEDEGTVAGWGIRCLSSNFLTRRL